MTLVPCGLVCAVCVYSLGDGGGCAPCAELTEALGSQTSTVVYFQQKRALSIFSAVLRCSFENVTRAWDAGVGGRHLASVIGVDRACAELGPGRRTAFLCRPHPAGHIEHGHWPGLAMTGTARLREVDTDSTLYIQTDLT